MDINEYLTRKKELEQFVNKNSRQLVKDYVQDFMTTHPLASAIRWRQYTPYFNDGEPCVFRVGEVHVLRREPTKEDLEMDPYDGDWEESDPSKKDPLLKALSKFEEEISGPMEDMLQVAFGDHKDIIVSQKNGKITIQVAEYEHD
jgi:hypothetical protein